MLKFFVLILIVVSISCDKRSGQSEKQPVSSPDLVQPNLEVEASLTHASLQISRALKSGFGEMVRKNRIEVANNPPNRDAHIQDDSTILSLVFSGNIHGERIDCGCRKNPLGGLARHATLIDEVSGVGKNWGLAANKNLLSLDAGDLFFKNIFDDVVLEKGRTPAIYNAKTIAAARKLMNLDVQNIGELDLVFGLSTLKELITTTGKKAVSANLYQDGKRIFEPFQIIDKGSLKIAVIGLTKEKSRKTDYFSSRNIESRNALKEYNDVRGSISNVDLVVLLSNLGVPNTRILLKGVSIRPDVVIVSNTNRTTKQPLFEKGVPILEPGSRGKYFGRADLILNGNEVGFANAAQTKLSRLDAYARTYRNYFSARIRYLRQVEKAQRAAITSETETHRSHSEEDHKHSPHTHEHKKDSKTFMKNAAVLQKQMATLAHTLVSQAEVLNVDSASTGDDFIETKIQDVKLDIIENPKIKSLITKREKKAPIVKKRAMPKR